MTNTTPGIGGTRRGRTKYTAHTQPRANLAQLGPATLGGYIDALRDFNLAALNGLWRDQRGAQHGTGAVLAEVHRHLCAADAAVQDGQADHFDVDGLFDAARGRVLAAQDMRDVVGHLTTLAADPQWQHLRVGVRASGELLEQVACHQDGWWKAAAVMHEAVTLGRC